MIAGAGSPSADTTTTTASGTVFESIGSDASPDYDLSFLSFTPSSATTFNEVATLALAYAFTLGSPAGPLNEPVTIQPTDNNGNFRIVDCRYMYSLATSSVPGPGRYRVEAVIGGTPAAGAAEFDLR